MDFPTGTPTYDRLMQSSRCLWHTPICSRLGVATQAVLAPTPDVLYIDLIFRQPTDVVPPSSAA
eukprot:COSAG02_NODE_552_length_20429_cov_28.014068_4_plen_64_part_00